MLKKSTTKKYFLLFADLVANNVFAQSWDSTGNNSWSLNATSSASSGFNNALNSFGLIQKNPTNDIGTISATVSSSDGSQASGHGSGPKASDLVRPINDFHLSSSTCCPT